MRICNAAYTCFRGSDTSLCVFKPHHVTLSDHCTRITNMEEYDKTEGFIGLGSMGIGNTPAVP